MADSTNNGPAARSEYIISFPIGGNQVKKVIVRDKIVPEDIYLNHVRGALYALKKNKALTRGTLTAARELKDFLIKTVTNI